MAENIAQLRTQGYGVDNDNDPAPENISEPEVPPKVTTQHQINKQIYQEWDSCTICHRTAQVLRNKKAKLVDDVPKLPNSSYIEYFFYMLPRA